MHRTIALMAVAVIVSGCAAPSVAVQVMPTPTPTAIPTAEPCAVQAAPYLDEAEQLMAAWADVTTLAEHTSRMALAPVISQMQEIRREVSRLDAPDCALIAHRLLVRAMDETINAYLAFMAQKPNQEVEGYLVEAQNTLSAATRAFYEVRTGEPAPTPTVPPLDLARQETLRVLEEAGLESRNCDANKTWAGRALTVRVLGLAEEPSPEELRPAMEASKAILHDPSLKAFALHIENEDRKVLRSVWVLREVVASYAAGELTFDDFAALWTYR